jgi:hypothetical protein
MPKEQDRWVINQGQGSGTRGRGRQVGNTLEAGEHMGQSKPQAAINRSIIRSDLQF